MQRSWIWVTSLAALSAIAAGCDNACDSALGRIDKRYEECGVAPPDPGDAPQNEACSSNDAALLECIATCTESSSCEGLDGTNSTARDDLTECYEDCAG